ncbi:hypothetical protein FA13DRAFT_1793997 [Coprinellus micaceus]|uniref:WD40 repeat-like protein n=1 Tax=Coprinellus micaceus TaxID=71717 RepID=A0A4Y7T4K5_COPMI|nr:hypothetical protein FA13DRAFT_1793997 [Coprinellus micaceus]
MVGFQATQYPVKSMTLSPDKSLLAISSGRNEITVWSRSAEVGGSFITDSLNCSQPIRINGHLLSGAFCWQSKGRLPHPPSFIPGGDMLQVTSVAWTGAESAEIVVSYLHHGVFSWSVSPRFRSRKLIHIDKVCSISLSPDGKTLAIPNQTSTFDLYDLTSKDKLGTLTDPDAVDNSEAVSKGLRVRPGQFIHRGMFFIGASVGKVHVWCVGTGSRAQRLSLDPDRSHLPVTLLTTSNSNTTKCKEYRVAACNRGPGQVIEIWKGNVHRPAPILPFVGAVSHSSPSYLRTLIICAIACLLPALLLIPPLVVDSGA